jgi:hypothetical protein
MTNFEQVLDSLTSVDNQDITQILALCYVVTKIAQTTPHPLHPSPSDVAQNIFNSRRANAINNKASLHMPRLQKRRPTFVVEDRYSMQNVWYAAFNILAETLRRIDEESRGQRRSAVVDGVGLAIDTVGAALVKACFQLIQQIDHAEAARIPLNTSATSPSRIPTSGVTTNANPTDSRLSARPAAIETYAREIVGDYFCLRLLALTDQSPSEHTGRLKYLSGLSPEEKTKLEKKGRADAKAEKEQRSRMAAVRGGGGGGAAQGRTRAASQAMDWLLGAPGRFIPVPPVATPEMRAEMDIETEDKRKLEEMKVERERHAWQAINGGGSRGTAPRRNRTAPQAADRSLGSPIPIIPVPPATSSEAWAEMDPELEEDRREEGERDRHVRQTVRAGGGWGAASSQSRTTFQVVDRVPGGLGRTIPTMLVASPETSAGVDLEAGETRKPKEEGWAEAKVERERHARQAVRDGSGWGTAPIRNRTSAQAMDRGSGDPRRTIPTLLPVQRRT